MTEFEGPLSIRTEELPRLYELLNSVFRQQGGDMSRGYPRHIGENNLANIRVIKQKGKIVSHVATSIRPVTLGDSHQSGGDRRGGDGSIRSGQGFASILMGDAVRRSIEQGRISC